MIGFYPQRQMQMRQHRSMKDRFHQCSNDELMMLRQLYQHYGEDFDSIATQMNTMFPESKKLSSKWRNLIHRKGISEVNNSYLSPLEFKQAYPILYGFVSQQKKHLCMITSPILRETGPTRIPDARTLHLPTIIQICHATECKEPYYDRVRSFSQLGWLLILYLSSHTPNALEQDIEWFAMLCAACRQYESWCRVLFNDGLGQLIDYSELANARTVQLLPQITPALFSEVMELLLSLDCVVRVCNSLSPYESIEYAYCGTKRIKKREKLKQKYIIDQMMENELPSEIPERQIFMAHDIQSLSYRRPFNPEFFTNMFPQQKNYLPLSKEQQRTILNSPEVQLLIPFMSALDQQISESPAL